MRIHKGIVSAFVCLGAAAGVWAVQARSCLRLHGRFVTDDLIVSRGQTYVPVSVLADALQLKVRNTADGCDLVGAADDLGQRFARDGYNLEVIDVARVGEYRAKYGYYDFPVVASPGKELVVVTCRLTNGTGFPQSIDLNNGRDTLLSDARFRSYAPLRGTGGRVLGGMLSILVGAQADFALKFEVPAGFRPDRLTVSIQNGPDRLPTDFRLSLARY